MKTCNKCKKEKLPIEFSKDKNKKDDLRHTCKECIREHDIVYNRTKNGLATNMYGKQRAISRHRGHNAPSYSNIELRKWLYSQTKFHILFDNWVKLNYQSDYKPSIDRKDDYVGYTMDNIQIMTWGENKNKHYNDRKNGINNKVNKAVIQINKKTNEVISHFHSIMEAGRKTEIHYTNIARCCMGKRKTAGGFIWKYK